jgi:hypothetical protein
MLLHENYYILYFLNYKCAQSNNNNNLYYVIVQLKRELARTNRFWANFEKFI